MSEPCDGTLHEAELDALLDGAAPSVELRTHLAACPACQRRRDELAALHALVLGEPLEEPPADLQWRIMAAVDVRRASARREFSSLLLESLAACALAVVLLTACPSLPSLGGLDGLGLRIEAMAPDLTGLPTDLVPEAVGVDGLPSLEALAVPFAGLPSPDELVAAVGLPEGTGALVTLLALTLAANLLIACGALRRPPERTTSHA